MPESERLQIHVETDVTVPAGATPRRLVDAIRRQLRLLEASPAGEQSPRSALAAAGLPSLFETRGGHHHMPQGFLPRVTEACRRHGVPFAVVDRRSTVSCPSLRSRLRLDEEQQEALRQLLLRDSGVIVAADPASRLALAAELIARRQQRTLVALDTVRQAEHWFERLAHALDLSVPELAHLGSATPAARVVIGRYQELFRLPLEDLRRGFGMVVFNGVTEVDPRLLLRCIRGAGARYLLGLAEKPVRADGLHGSIFLSLGGAVHRLDAPSPWNAGLELGLVRRETDFAFAYEGRHQYQALVAALAADDRRAAQVAEDIAAEAAAGACCLVLSERRDHLERLSAMLPSGIEAQVLTSALRPADRARILDRLEGGQLNVLLATSQIAKEAAVSGRVNRLFFTFPFSYARKLEAAVRTLLRPAPGKRDALLYDYDDALVAPLHRAFAKRQEYLSRLRRAAEAEHRSRRQMTLPLP